MELSGLSLQGGRPPTAVVTGVGAALLPSPGGSELLLETQHRRAPALASASSRWSRGASAQFSAPTCEGLNRPSRILEIGVVYRSLMDLRSLLLPLKDGLKCSRIQQVFFDIYKSNREKII